MTPTISPTSSNRACRDVGALRLFAVVFALLMATRTEAALIDAAWSGIFVVQGAAGSSAQVPTTISGPGTTTVVVPGAQATLTTGLTPSPFLSVSGTTTASRFESFWSQGTLTYSMQIIGPAGLVPLQVNATGLVSLTNVPLGTGSGYAEAGLTVAPAAPTGGADTLGSLAASTFINKPTSPFLTFPPVGPYTNSPDVTGSAATGYTGGFAINGIFTAYTNTIYTVTLTENIDVFVPQRSITASGSVFIDPTFNLAPSVSNPALYSIVFSPGVGNSNVPDTGVSAGVFALLIAGLVAARRRVGSPDDVARSKLLCLGRVE